MNLSSNGTVLSRGLENGALSPPPAPRTYHLQILQQPVTGTEHDPYVLSQLPLTPPLLLRLRVSNCTGVQIAIDDEFPFLVAHLHLLTEYAVPIQEPPSSPCVTSSQRSLYGSIVASPQAFLDQQGSRGYFFSFPNVTVRVRGRYRLGVTLTRLQTDALNIPMVGGCLAQVVTDTFEVSQQSQSTATQNPVPAEPGCPSAEPNINPDVGEKNISIPDWITLIKPLPPAGESVIILRRETHVTLAINFDRLPIPSALGCNGIQIPPTGSVRNYADTTGKTLLQCRIRLYGATTKRYYETVCAGCDRRQGKKRGVPGLIDFHAEREIIGPKDGKVHVDFTFCCYPKDHQLGDRGYLLEVVLSESEGQKRIVAQCRLPFSFIVLPKLPPIPGQKSATRRRKRVELEQAEGAALALEPRSVRPRLDITNVLMQRNHPSNEQIHHPAPATHRQKSLQCVQSHEDGPFNPPSLVVPTQPPQNTATISGAIAPPRIDSEPAPTLTEVNPEAGSITGGARIWLKGINFSSRFPLFARFGTNVVPTTFSASNLLACHLPPAAMPGIVDVTLSKDPQTNTPEYGTSIAKFEYFGDHDLLLPILLCTREGGYYRPWSDSARRSLAIGTAHLSSREDWCYWFHESLPIVRRGP